MVAEHREAILELFPRQTRFVECDRKFPAAIGGIGSGKTFIGAAKVISRLDAAERGMIVAPTYDMLRLATLDMLWQMLGSIGLEEDKDFTYNKNEKEITFTWGHKIVCRSAERYQNLRGPNLDYCWVDEAALLDKEAWRIIKGRVRRGRNPQTWITTTPKGRNWIYQEWVAEATGNEFDPIHPIYKFSTTENPTLPNDFVRDLGYDGTFYEQEISGEFVGFDGLVYPGFTRAMVEEVECQSWGSIIAVDVGTRNPTAILTIRYVGDRYHIEREFYQRGLGAEDIINSVEEAYISANATFAVVDPSAAGHIQDMRNRGMTVRPADNDVIVGIQRVTTVLPTLTVDPSCVNTISEFESYQYSDKAARDVPIKANDHALDAFRYGIMELTAPSKAFAPIDGDVAAFFKRAGVRFR